jgi:hypothetical protein
MKQTHDGQIDKQTGRYMNGQMERRTNGKVTESRKQQTYKQTDGQTDGQTDRRTDGQTDKWTDR